MVVAEDIRPMLAPAVMIDHDRVRYKIQVDLPGVKIDDIELEVSENSFCIQASRNDADLTGCYFLAHPVNIDEVDAAFDDRFLNVEIPFKVPIRGKRIEIRRGESDLDQESGRTIELREGSRSMGSGTQ
jgi:HSP20 family protein